MGALFVFPAPTTVDVCCPQCERPIAQHRLTARGYQCVQDIVVNRDQATEARRARLARLQSRVSRVRPFGIDVEGMEAR